MSEFIPGPWNIGTKNGARVWSENGETLIADADVSESLRKEIKKANARLIAAAPDLLDALVELSKSFIGTYGDDPRSDNEIDLHREFWEKRARAAIAKATGGEK